MAQQLQFTAFSRLLHWTMAIMVLAMLFIGVGMVASLSNYHWLISIHKPLGILILILVAIRLANRLLNPAPPLPQGMPACQPLCGARIACRSLRAAVRVAARRLGDAVGSALPYRALSIGGAAADPVARCRALRRAADDAHGLGLSLVRYVHRSFRRRADARADLPGRCVSEHGVLKPRLGKFSGTPQMTGSA
jgi:hypothetical protein